MRELKEAVVCRERVCALNATLMMINTHTLFDTQQQSQRDRSLWEGSRQTSPKPVTRPKHVHASLGFPMLDSCFLEENI